MAGGTVTYTYQQIDDLVSDLNKCSQQIQNEIDSLVKETHQLCDSVFKGQSAQDYNNQANGIAQDLTSNTQALNAIAKQTQSGSNNMQQSDQNNAKRFQ